MKPIDLQIIVPKSYEAARVQQNLKHGNQVQQNLLSVQSNEQLKNLKRRVVKRSKTKDIRLDKEKPKQKKYSSKRRAMKQKEEIQKTKDKRILNKHIDIKI